MNTHRLTPIVGASDRPKVKPAHRKKKSVDDLLLSSETAWTTTTTTQPPSLQRLSSNTKMISSDTHHLRRPSVPLLNSNHTRSLAKGRQRDLNVISTPDNIKYSKLLLIVLATIVTVSALAALAISIYDIIRGQQASSTTTSTMTSTIFALRWQAVGTTVAGLGSAGAGLDRFSTPYSIAVDSSKAFYVADYYNNRIQKFTPSSSIGMTVAGQTGGAFGSTLYDLYHPTSVLLDSNGNLYVSDSGNHRVQFFPNGSTVGTTVAGTGAIGSLIHELSSPRGLARNSVTGTLYIVDNGNHRVVSYSSGVPSLAAGGNGSGILVTQLNSPTGLAFDLSSNSLFIANTGSHNIVRWRVNASSWTLVTGSPTGGVGTTSTMLYSPFSIILDSFGNIYVTDYSNARIQFFTPGRLNGTTIAGVTSTPGNLPTLLNAPYSAALDSDFNLYVADAGNQRIQKFLRY